MHVSQRHDRDDTTAVRLLCPLQYRLCAALCIDTHDEFVGCSTFLGLSGEICIFDDFVVVRKHFFREIPYLCHSL